MLQRIDRVGIRGLIEYWLLDLDGNVVEHHDGHNLVTAVGDRMYLEQGANLAGAPGVATGMRLGTLATQPSKTGAGAAIGTYVAGSSKPFDAGYPLPSGTARLTYMCTWPAGVATTGSYITEVALTNEAGPSDYAGVEADTVARALLRPAVKKPFDRALVLAWHHDSYGT